MIPRRKSELEKKGHKTCDTRMQNKTGKPSNSSQKKRQLPCWRPENISNTNKNFKTRGSNLISECFTKPVDHRTPPDRDSSTVKILLQSSAARSSACSLICWESLQGPKFLAAYFAPQDRPPVFRDHMSTVSNHNQDKWRCLFWRIKITSIFKIKSLTLREFENSVPSLEIQLMARNVGSSRRETDTLFLKILGMGEANSNENDPNEREIFCWNSLQPACSLKCWKPFHFRLESRKLVNGF